MTKTELSLAIKQIATPCGVDQLRRLVLALAVRGRLLSREPVDRMTPDSFVVPSPGDRIFHGAHEYPFPVPATWRWVSCGRLYSNRGQRKPSTPITYIDVSSIDNQRGELTQPTVLSAEEAPTRARKVVDTGDVIYSCVRPYLSNVAIIDRKFDPQPIASTAFAVLNGRDLCLPRYLWMVLRSPFMCESVTARMRGQSYPAINDADFKMIQIPLPSVGEQKKIIEKVGHLLTLSDELEAALGRKEEFGRALMNAITPRQIA